MPVGTLNEKHLHAGLKAWYARPGDRLEVAVEGFVADIVRDGRLIEIQTANVSGMRRKLALLSHRHPLRLVIPLAAEKWLVKLPDGPRRRSPKHQAWPDVFAELVSIPDLLCRPTFEVEVLLTAQEERRRFDGRRGRRRRGWVVEERRLLEVRERRRFDDPADLAGLIPVDVVEPFGTADLARALGRPRRLGQQMAYCLREAGALVPAGKAGNARLYRRVS